MLKRFDLKDFIHFAYLAVIALVLAAVMAILINTAIELLNDGLNQAYQKTAFDYYVYLFSISFIYLSICKPLIKPAHVVQEQPQCPDLPLLREEIEMVYLISYLLDGEPIWITSDSVLNMNKCMASYLNDDTLFEEIETRESMSMVRHVLKASRLDTENRVLANRRLNQLIKKLMALDDMKK